MLQKWRLVNGRELYDIEIDHEQRSDVSSCFPEVVSSLRKAYEHWWEMVSIQYDQDVPIVLGEETVEFTSHELRNEESDTAWNQKQIRKGYRIDGYYEIDVRDSGYYQILLSRWPFSEKISLTEGIKNDITFNKEDIQQKNWSYYEGGKQLPIDKAHISIQDKVYEMNIKEDEKRVKFQVVLQKGIGRMEAWFTDCNGHALTSAYYIQVIKL